jgi:hypothetical protein
MLFKLLTAPLATPLAGVGFVLRQVGNMAEQELYSVERIREELLLLQLRLEEGNITEDEFRAQEADVMVRLRTARERQQRAGL